jgi:hypothetical protein
MQRLMLSTPCCAHTQVILLKRHGARRLEGIKAAVCSLSFCMRIPEIPWLGGDSRVHQYDEQPLAGDIAILYPAVTSLEPQLLVCYYQPHPRTKLLYNWLA